MGRLREGKGGLGVNLWAKKSEFEITKLNRRSNNAIKIPNTKHKVEAEAKAKGLR